MYVVKKCENHSYGRNKWDVVFTSPDREDAISWVREEYRLLLSCDSNLTSKDIEQRMSYGCPQSGSSVWGRREVLGRREFGHMGTYFSFFHSHSDKYLKDVPMRPTRTELLDSILS
jgi:hypothetical protein